MILARNCAFRIYGVLKPLVLLWVVKKYLGNQTRRGIGGSEAENGMGRTNGYAGDRELENPLAASHMGIDLCKSGSPEGKPDPLAAAYDIRETFG